MLTVGTRVQLRGLVAKPELNGKEGVCREWNADNGRWKVVLDGDGGEVAVKGANLDPVSMQQQADRPIVAHDNQTQAAAKPMSGPSGPNRPPFAFKGRGKEKASAAQKDEGKGKGKGGARASFRGKDSQRNDDTSLERETLGLGSDTGASAVVEGLDQLLSEMGTSRKSVCDAMVYCMDNAPSHAATLARRLCISLGKVVGLTVEAALARLFVVSDVLHNSTCKKEGAHQYRMSFQEFLPDAFEKFGRLWLRKLDSQADLERSEAQVRQVLQVWERLRIFPDLYTKGLESILFMPVEQISAKEANNWPDERLRQKITRWFAGIIQSELPSLCQQRGLAGRGLPMHSYRARLCHFEKYWHIQVGTRVRLHGLQAAPHLNNLAGMCEQWDLKACRWKVKLESGEVKAVRQDNLSVDVPSIDDLDLNTVLNAIETPGGGNAAPVTPIAGGTPAPGTPIAAPNVGGQAANDNDSIDGEPLSDCMDGDPMSDEELLELVPIKAALVAEKAGARVRTIHIDINAPD